MNFNIKLNRTHVNYLINWLFIIFFFTQPVYGQKSSFLSFREIVPELPQYVESAPDLALPTVNISSYIQTNKIAAIPDSVYEMKKEGFITWYSHWYYHKSGSEKLDSVTIYYIDEEGVFTNITESTIYNSSGLPKKFIHRQDQALYGEHRDTTTFLATYIEEYEYEFEGDKMIWKKNKTPNTKTSCAICNINEYFYTYDEQGKLTCDILIDRDSLDLTCVQRSAINIEPYYHRRSCHYFYNENNKIEYELIISGSEICDRSAKKYTYQITDSTILSNIKYGTMCSRSTDPAAIDSLATWSDKESSYLEIFDEEGRRTSLTITGQTSFDYLVKNTHYKIEFTYTDMDSLQHVTYYYLDDVYSDAEWKEFMHEYYTYNDDGNILLYEKKVYDLWTDSWDLKTKREYFYERSSTHTSKNSRLQSICLYPNPTEDYIIIENKSGIENLYYQLFNLNGAILIAGDLHNSVEQIKISTFPTGIYYLKFTSIENHKISDTFKIIKY